MTDKKINECDALEQLRIAKMHGDHEEIKAALNVLHSLNIYSHDHVVQVVHEWMLEWTDDLVMKLFALCHELNQRIDILEKRNDPTRESLRDNASISEDEQNHNEEQNDSKSSFGALESRTDDPKRKKKMRMCDYCKKNAVSALFKLFCSEKCKQKRRKEVETRAHLKRKVKE